MSDFDAYEDEMGLLFASRDREIERLLSGAPPQDEELDELSVFVADVRDTYVEPLDEGLQVRHLAAISAAVRAGETRAAVAERAKTRSGGIQMRHRFGRPVAKLAAAAAVALAALTGGLAVAGVDIPVLPDQAADQAKEAVAEHAVGQPVDLGRPGDPGAQQEERPPEFVAQLRELMEQTPPEERGCEFGQAVATIASGSDPTEGDPCAEGENGNQGGNAGQPQGSKATGVQASGGIAGNPPTTGASKATGDQASGGVSTSPPQTGGKATGDQASGGISSGAGAAGPQIGQDAAAGAQEVAPVTIPAPAPGGRP